MDEKQKHEKTSEFKSKSDKWIDNSISQLSFFNNLILTLALAFLSFSVKPELFKDLTVDSNQKIDWNLVMLVVSISTCIMSILIGLFVGMSRLSDFRITRKIFQTRLRLHEFAGIIKDREPSIPYNRAKRLKLIYDVMNSNFPKITIEECKEYNSSQEIKEKIDSEYSYLLNIASNLGRSTWENSFRQIVFFSISILSYFLHLIT